MNRLYPSRRFNLRRTGLLLLLAGVPLYTLVCIGCATFQRRMIYFPPHFTPAQCRQLARAEGLELWRTAGGKAIGWKRLSPIQPAQGRVLITHGNASAAVQCGHYADVIQQAAPLDVFILEYPGYADRPGEPSEATLDQAADEAFGLLAAKGPVYLVGESLGTGVAAHVAAGHPDQVAGVALLGAYTSLADVAQAHMPLIPVHLLLRDRFPAEDDLKNYHGPLAILAGGKDTVVPEKFGRRLYKSYAGPKRFWDFSQEDHGSLMLQSPAVWKQIVGFWQSPGAAKP